MSHQIADLKSNPTYIKVQKNLQRIAVEEIVYLKSNDDHVQIIFKDNSVIQPRITLKKLLEQLPQDLFVQIHRSYAAAIQHIETISSDEINITGKKLPIGRMYKAHLKQTLKKLSLQIS